MKEDIKILIKQIEELNKSNLSKKNFFEKLKKISEKLKETSKKLDKIYCDEIEYLKVKISSLKDQNRIYIIKEDFDKLFQDEKFFNILLKYGDNNLDNKTIKFDSYYKIQKYMISLLKYLEEYEDFKNLNFRDIYIKNNKGFIKKDYINFKPDGELIKYCENRNIPQDIHSKFIYFIRNTLLPLEYVDEKFVDDLKIIENTDVDNMRSPNYIIATTQVGRNSIIYFFMNLDGKIFVYKKGNVNKGLNPSNIKNEYEILNSLNNPLFVKVLTISDKSDLLGLREFLNIKMNFKLLISYLKNKKLKKEIKNCKNIVKFIIQEMNKNNIGLQIDFGLHEILILKDGKIKLTDFEHSYYKNNLKFIEKYLLQRFNKKKFRRIFSLSGI